MRPTLALLGIVFSTGCATYDGVSPTAIPDRIILTWSDDPVTTQSVTWRTYPGSAKPVGEIAIATDGPGFASAARSVNASSTSLVTDNGSALYHTVVFRGLHPETKYAYRVGDGTHWSEWSHFVTASREAKPFSLIYFGDAQNDIKSHWSRVVREAFKDAPRAAFLLHAGDLINRANADAEWAEWFYGAGWILRTMPSIATPGNHEYRNGTISAHWDPVFEFPRNGPPGLQSSVYYIDYQGTRIVSLDSNRDVEKQAAWLDGVLAANPHRWTIVTMHHPIYSTARDRDNPQLRAQLQPIFDRHAVDLVLQGHDHTYGRTGLMRHDHAHDGDEAHDHDDGATHERSEGTNVPTGANVQTGPGGTVYVVSVSGPKMYGLDQKPFMKSAVANKQLYQLISVDGDELRYSAFTATGKLFDRFTLRKSAGAPNELVDMTPR